MRGSKRIVVATLIVAIATSACSDEGDAATAATSIGVEPTSTPSTTAAAPATTTPPTTEPPQTAPPIVGIPQLGAFSTPDYPGPGSPTYLETVRTESYDDFTRVVFEFTADAPEFAIEYLDGPVVAGPAGEPIEASGEAALSISMAPASGVDLTGEYPVVTYSGPDRLPIDSEVVNELVRIDDFDNHTTWVVGLEDRLPFSVVALENPGRVVLDIHETTVTPVAAPASGKGDFAIHAFTTAAGICFAVVADAGNTVCVPPGYRLEHELVRVGDESMLLGLVYDEAIVDVDLVAHDGSAFPEDAEAIELVTIDRGVRAFVPLVNPHFVREIRGLGADGSILFQAQVGVSA